MSVVVPLASGRNAMTESACHVLKCAAAPPPVDHRFYLVSDWIPTFAAWIPEHTIQWDGALPKGWYTYYTEPRINNLPEYTLVDGECFKYWQEDSYGESVPVIFQAEVVGAYSFALVPPFTFHWYSGYSDDFHAIWTKATGDPWGVYTLSSAWGWHSEEAPATVTLTKVAGVYVHP